MYKYIACELHSHTLHSDGSFSVFDLLESAKHFQYDALAITDHNTTSAHEEITEKMKEKYLPVLYGMEWTTFFGHMVVIGNREFVDWRFAIPDTIDTYIEQVKKSGGIVGIAHPMDIGGAICTGCHWNYNVKNWYNVDYIEVWNGRNPTLDKNRVISSMASIKYWTNLLNKGERIAITAGTDWHSLSSEDTTLPKAVTYVGINDDENTSTDSIKKGIKSGNTFISLGPFIDVKIKQNNKIFTLGDEIKKENFSLKVDIDESKRKDVWRHLNINTTTVKIIQNGNVLYEYTNGLNFSRDLSKDDIETGWLRIEIYGDCLGEKDILLGLTSPVYIQ